MPEHDDDQMDRVFRDAYAALMERAPTAPTLEEITTIAEAPSQVTSLLGHPHQEGGDSEPGDQSLDRTVESNKLSEDGSNVEARWEDVEKRAPSERSRWSGVAIAAAAAILVVVGVVFVADRDDRDVVTESASTPAEADPVPSPSVTDRPVSSPGAAEPVVPPSVFDPVSSYRWSLVASGCCPGGASADGAMGDVTVGGPGLVAVGSDGSDDFLSDAAVWTSVDGITWSRLPHDEEVFGGGWMESVTEGGPGLVAVGSSGSNEERGLVGRAAVWTSADGITWSRVPHDEAIFGGTSMNGVIAGGPGLVAVGGDGDAAVWTSVDGLTWSRVPHDEEIFGGPGEQWMGNVTVGGPGLVAVGVSRRIDETASAAVVWTSVDGISWSRVHHEEAVFDGELYMGGVTAGGPGLVAVGGDGDAVVWTSVDGITWSRVPRDDSVFGGPGDQEPASVTVGGPGLVAVGMEGYCECSVSESPNGYVPVVWTSVDGVTWSRVPYDEAVFGDHSQLTVTSVTAGGPGLVAVGTGGVIVAERVATPEN